MDKIRCIVYSGPHKVKGAYETHSEERKSAFKQVESLIKNLESQMPAPMPNSEIPSSNPSICAEFRFSFTEGEMNRLLAILRSEYLLALPEDASPIPEGLDYQTRCERARQLHARRKYRK